MLLRDGEMLRLMLFIESGQTIATSFSNTKAFGDGRGWIGTEFMLLSQIVPLKTRYLRSVQNFS